MSNAVRIAILADGGRARRELDSVARSGSSMGRTLAKAGRLAGTGALALGAAAAAIGVAAVKSASAAEQSLGATETVFGRYAKRVERDSDRAAKAFGLSANEYRENANLIGSLLGNQGVATDQLAGKSKKLIGTAADLAATFGGTTADSVAALSSAFKGEFDPLEAYGISLKQSTVNTAAFKAANVSSQTEFNKLTLAQQTAAKQLATTNLIQEQSAKSAGAFSRETGTLAHQQQVLGAQAENLKSKLGTALLPVATKVFTFLNDKAVPAAEKAGRWLGDKLGPAVAYVGEVLKGSAGDADGLGGAINDLGGLVDDGKRAWETFGPAITEVAKKAIPLMINQLKATVKTLKAMADAAIFVYNNAIQPLATQGTKAFGKLLTSISKTLGVLGSVPGAPAWIGRTAEKAGIAGAKLGEISTAIRKIPDSKDVRVRALTDDARAALKAINDYKLPDKTIRITTTTNATLAEAGRKSKPKPAGGDRAPRDLARAAGAGILAGIEQGADGVGAVLDRLAAQIVSTYATQLNAVRKVVKEQSKGKVRQAALELLATKNEKAQRKATDALTKATAGQAAKLNEQAAAHGEIVERLKAEQENLKAATADRDAYAASVRASTVASGNVVGLGVKGTKVSLSKLLAELQGKVATAETYTKVIQSLTAAGLNQANLQQLIDAGAEGGLSTAQAILAGGPSAITQINTLAAQLDATGKDLGASTASTMKDAGVATAQGYVAGVQAELANSQAQLLILGQQLAAAYAVGLASSAKPGKAAEDQADQVVKKSKKKLKVKSPSRVFLAIGRNVSEGLALGLDDVYVSKRAEKMAGALEQGFGSPKLRAFQTKEYAGASGLDRPAAAPAGPLIGNVTMQPGESAEQFAERLWFKLRSRG